jgi:hypothetical protein
MKKDQVWDFIIEYGIATEAELILVTNINGFTLEQLNNVIYAKIGYRSMEQYIECELNED